MRHASLSSTSGVPNQNGWNLDALGNWSSGNGSNSQNEETANGTHTLAYDNAGNITTDEIGNTYIYDAWGHVVSIHGHEAVAGTKRATDRTGGRVSRASPGSSPSPTARACSPANFRRRA